MKQLLLAAAVVLATVSLVVSGELDLTFYKLSLQWPPSACSFEGKKCIPNIPDTFTIHGLWPQYDNDEPVLPYEKDRTCTTVIPTSADDIIDKLKCIEGELKDCWPNLYLNRKGKRDDLGFWKYEWREHGMCSDYPNKPYDYFEQALLLHQKYKPLKVMGIQPGESLHQVSTILDNIKKELGYDPQIACNFNPVIKKLQLWEIRLCFHKTNPPSLRDCPRLDLKKTCKKETEKIIFPPALALRYSNSEMNVEYRNVSDINIFNIF